MSYLENGATLDVAIINSYVVMSTIVYGTKWTQNYPANAHYCIYVMLYRYRKSTLKKEDM